MIEEEILKSYKNPKSEGRRVIEKELREFENFHSERRNVLGSIFLSESWHDLLAYELIVRNIGLALGDIGIAKLPEYSKETRYNSAYITVNGKVEFEAFVARKMAERMLKAEESFSIQGKLSLNQLFDETFLND
jgi:hypothetical protein